MGIGRRIGFGWCLDRRRQQTVQSGLMLLRALTIGFGTLLHHATERLALLRSGDTLSTFLALEHTRGLLVFGRLVF